MKIRVLFDGWPLVYSPNHSSSLHLLELLSNFPENCEPYLALPAHGFLEINITRDIPAPVNLIEIPAEKDVQSRIWWEQRILIHVADKVQTNLIHLTTENPALMGSVPIVVSPTGQEDINLHRNGSLAARLRYALSKGGFSRVRGVFWPEGLPVLDNSIPVLKLPELVLPDFNSTDFPNKSNHSDLELPETYLLYHGPQDITSLRRLLAVWSWAADSIGELYPLVLLGITNAEKRIEFQAIAKEANLENYLIMLPQVPIQSIPSIYRGCSGVLQLGEIAAWGEPARYALACGKPLVAEESILADALVGPAGYLFKPTEIRQMGGALLAIVVNEDIAGTLSKAAAQQIANWKTNLFQERLRSAYEQVLGF